MSRSYEKNYPEARISKTFPDNSEGEILFGHNICVKTNFAFSKVSEGTDEVQYYIRNLHSDKTYMIGLSYCSYHRNFMMLVKESEKTIAYASILNTHLIQSTFDKASVALSEVRFDVQLEMDFFTIRMTFNMTEDQYLNYYTITTKEVK